MVVVWKPLLMMIFYNGLVILQKASLSPLHTFEQYDYMTIIQSLS